MTREIIHEGDIYEVPPNTELSARILHLMHRVTVIETLYTLLWEGEPIELHPGDMLLSIGLRDTLRQDGTEVSAQAFYPGLELHDRCNFENEIPITLTPEDCAKLKPLPWE